MERRADGRANMEDPAPEPLSYKEMEQIHRKLDAPPQLTSANAGLRFCALEPNAATGIRTGNYLTTSKILGLFQNQSSGPVILSGILTRDR